MEEPAAVPAHRTKPFSWRDPHPAFVIFLVGPDEVPFGLQKDFLCARSTHFKAYFRKDIESEEQDVERIEKLPNTSMEVFGLMQNFLYTGQLVSGDDDLPAYDVLIEVWKLGNEFGIPKLCTKTLETMQDCRRVTQSIPATPLLVQAWKDTPESSDLRKLLLDWATEYLRSSDSKSRAEFSKSLPKEVLSDLVLEMSSMGSGSLAQIGSTSPSQASSHAQAQLKKVHSLDAEDNASETPSKSQRRDSSDTASTRLRADQPNGQRKPLPRGSRSTPAKTPKPRQPVFKGYDYKDQKLIFCSDLINRMLSGPGFWTRLVPLFRDPVDPIENGIPDYLEKIKKPMDLGTIRDKMNEGKYESAEQFVADVRQIFTNCYTYWDEGTITWESCKRLEKTFEEKYSNMPKWLAKQGEEDD